jgi:hypothetical protein
VSNKYEATFYDGNPDIDEAYKQLRYQDRQGRLWIAKLGGWLHSVPGGKRVLMSHKDMQDLIREENP